MRSRPSFSVPQQQPQNNQQQDPLLIRRRSSMSNALLLATQQGGSKRMSSAHNNVLLGDAANFIPPNLHVSMLVHPDGIALYAKLQTDPYFRDQQQQQQLHSFSAFETQQQQQQQQQNKKSIREQLATNRAIVDVARAAYQHPLTAPVLKFPLPFDATPESIAEEAIEHFLELLEPSVMMNASSSLNPLELSAAAAANASTMIQNAEQLEKNRQRRKKMLEKARRRRKKQKESENNGDTSLLGAKKSTNMFAGIDQVNENEDTVFSDEDEDEDDEEGLFDPEEILPAVNAEDLELYVYHVEDPDLFKRDFSSKGLLAQDEDDPNEAQANKDRRAKQHQNIMSEIIAQQQQATGAGGRNRVNHTSIPIGDYENSPPLLSEVPVRIQLNLFQLIAAARKRRRKFIVRSGLHPSAVEECSPLNVYAVLTVSPFWLERRALEIQEETAREDVAKNESRYMKAIHEAHMVSFNRAVARAKGHRQIRAFQGEVESFFLNLALRNALVQQASMNVQDVISKHMQRWPQALQIREVMFEQELKKRRCLFTDYTQRLKLEHVIRSKQNEMLFY